MKTPTLALLSLAALACPAPATPVTEAVTIRNSDGAILNTVAANFTAGKLKVGGVSITATPAWSAITGKPTTLSGFGITDPVVVTNTSYNNPAWIIGLSWTKINSRPGTLEGYGITVPGSGLTGGTAGSLQANGGEGDEVSLNGGAGGTITMTGGDTNNLAAGGNAGSISTSGSGIFKGGNINTASDGSRDAGTINTEAGGSLTTGAGNLAGPATGGTILINTDIGSSLQAANSNLTALASNSTNGLWARTGTGAGAARTIAAGKWMTVTNGSGASGNPTVTATDRPSFRAESHTTQIIPTSIRTKVLYDAEIEDNGNCFASSRWTPITPSACMVTVGAYSYFGYDYFGATIAIFKNGSMWSQVRAGKSDMLGVIVDHVPMNGTTDYLEIYVAHNAGFDVSMYSHDGDDVRSYFWGKVDQ